MMVSELFAFIGQIVHMNFGGQVVVAIPALIAGSFAHRFTRNMESSIWLTVIGLVLVLFTINAVQAREILWAVILTTCLVVVGYEGYRRLTW
jgi:site-specific recombinase